MAKKPAAAGKGAKAKKAPKEKKAKAASAKGRSIKNDAGATNPTPTAKNDVKQISEKDYQAVQRRRTSLKKQGKEISGSASEILASASENKNLDKPANAFIEKLWAMSPQKRQTTLACFDHYRTFKHFDTGKTLDEDETGQGTLDIPRQEAGAGKGEPAKDPTGASAQKPNGDGKVVDLRPKYMIPVSEGGTKVETDAEANDAGDGQPAVH